MTSLNLIWAQARDAQGRAVIGKDNAIPWRLPEDMAHLKATTMGHPVLMGRKTWDSLPPRFRPLPGRRNLVMTRQHGWAEGVDAKGAEVVASVEAAIQACAGEPELWVLGGSEIYRLCLTQADRLVVTDIELQVEGDAFAPPLGAEWTETSRERHTAASGIRFSFVDYRRTAA